MLNEQWYVEHCLWTDYAVSSDFQMLVSQWVASGSHYLRKCLITHLELLYRAQMPKFDEWSINVLSVILKVFCVYTDNPN